MRIAGLFVLLFLVILADFQGKAQNIFEGWEHLFQPKKNYVVYKTPEKIAIDGKANEISWERAQWTDLFVDIEGENKELPTWSTKIKMLWDDKNLYILAELTEPHIWAYYTKHDQIVYHENDFEIFIDPNRNIHEYFEFEINAQNTLFDLFMTKPYRNGGIPLISWNANGFRSAVHLNGTLNQPNDTDKSWTIEMAIPFHDLRLGVHTQKPENGTYWSINFSRVQWQTDVIDGKYVRKKDETTGRILPENNWVWSPAGVINMHFPERWGILQFSTFNAGEKVAEFILPPEEKYLDYLWLLYYKQSQFRGENKTFAKTLEELDFPANSEKDVVIEMQATRNQFFAELKTDEGLKLTINHEGRISKN
ncbi:carbohydrate-binding family 9-like protein [Mariniphaga sp.]|uniref:carbohydrate-binding family 9-like protein n=1 Tax=Mariniphaga sp. TaxID=1954475 RepID=UPI0035626684